MIKISENWKNRFLRFRFNRWSINRKKIYSTTTRWLWRGKVYACHCSRWKKIYTRETKATKLTYNQTVCPHCQQHHGCVRGTILYFVALISYVFFFIVNSKRAHTFPFHNHLVATSLCAPHLLHLPTACKNSCLVRIHTTYFTKPAVSQLLSEIQCSSCTCLMDNEPQNTLIFLVSIRCIVCRYGM